MVAAEVDPADLNGLLDEFRIVRVVNAYFRSLDSRQFDESHFRRLLVPDARMVRPNGMATVGADDIAASHARSFARFEATQHLLAGHDVAIDGDMAVVQANLIAIHLWNDRPAEMSMLDRSFIAGGVVSVALRRSAEGWRISELENRVIWRTGHFGDMLQTR